MGKGPEAFRTISEVAEDLDVPKHVLRFWETKFSHVKPMKRGGGRRYYRPEDVELLRGIRTLLHDEGYSIRGLQRVFRQHGVNYIKKYPLNLAAGGDRQSGAVARVPDIAGEAAGHAREEAMQRSRTPARAAKRPAGAGNLRNQTAGTGSRPLAKPPEAGLSAVQRETLAQALAELEACRRLLASATAE